MTAPGAERNHFGWRFTTPLLLASALNPINSSMIATGLTDIAREFAVSPGAAASLVAVLYLCSAIAHPAVGKLGVVFGPRRVFFAGLVIVVIGGLVGTFAPSFGWLLVARALIGVGTSAAYPTSMALVRSRADRAGLGPPTRVIGLLAIAAQVSLVIGLPLGGVLTSVFGWRALFAANVPLALVALVAVLTWVQRDPVVEARTARQWVRDLDLAGIVLFAAAMSTLLVFLGALPQPRWWLLGASAVLVALLVGRELRAADPLIDVRLLVAEPALARTYLRQVLAGLAVYTAFYGLSQWMGAAAALEAAVVGVVMLPLSAVSIVVARIVSLRGWVRGALLGGALAMAAAGALLLALDSDMPGLVPLLAGVAVVYGLAHGLTSVASQTALYLQAPAAQMATAAGLLRSFSYIGAAFSASIISITFGAVPTDAGLHRQGWVIIAVGAILFVLALDRALPPRAGPRR